MATVTRTIQSSFSGHTMFVQSIAREELPKHIQEKATEWQQFYVVKNFDAKGVVFFYLAKGYRHPDPQYANDKSAHAPKQITAYYPNGKMWSSYGENLKDAIEGAQRDGWYAAMAN